MIQIELARTNAQDKVLKTFYDYLDTGCALTRTEGNPEHLCVYFLPLCMRQQSIYLVDHIKADAWIPPGGHVEPGEKPEETVLREFAEELGIEPSVKDLRLIDLTITPISGQQGVCVKHFDLWYVVKFFHEKVFEWDKGEFRNAKWFGFEEGINKLQKYPDYSLVIKNLQQQTFNTYR